MPFFSLSASEFVEMIVGVGASRVRDLFKQAKEAAPAIIFIDELDAIGRSRGGSGGFGGHDEREQTLNQILTEMDGFTGSEGVIVLAATNRPEILDPALLRPGRFDRRVTVQTPDRDGRLRDPRRSTRARCRSADDVDLESLAAATPGMVGADLASLINEAALLAARRDHEKVSQRRPRRRPGEDRARRRAPDGDVRGGARAHRLPRVRPRAGRHAQPGRRPCPQDLDHPARPRARGDVPVADADRYGYDPRSIWRAASIRGPWAAAPPSSSCTATSRPVPSRTSSSSRRSPARWSGAGA